jgi:hypothetical protein
LRLRGGSFDRRAAEDSAAEPQLNEVGFEDAAGWIENSVAWVARVPRRRRICSLFEITCKLPRCWSRVRSPSPAPSFERA